jgi:hypothetical protein
MFDFCYGHYDLKYCYSWLIHLDTTDALILIALFLIGLFILLRLFYWFFKDFNLW